MIVRKKLGEILIEKGLLTEEQLNKALIEHKKEGLKLGKFLVRRSLVNERQIVDVLSRQLKIEMYHPDLYPLDTSLAETIPFDAAQRHQVMPLKKQGRLLTIALTDPLDISSLDSIAALTGSEVEPVICTESELTQLHNSLYGMHSGLTGIMEGMQINVDSGKTEDGSEEVKVGLLQNMADEAPVIRLVNSIFTQAIRAGASDIHISPQKDKVQLRYRIDGRLHDMPPPPKSMFLPLVVRIKIQAMMDITVSRVPQDGRFTLRMDSKEINVRVSSIPTIYGENLVLRLLDMGAGVYTLDRLGMAKGERESMEAVINKPYGMILSTGPTGSGKSTSLYSLLSEINKPEINIITLEDPVEYRIDNIRQVQLNRKAGMTFAGGLRSVLRQDPDVIMVGEIRDAETAAISVQAAQTGHRVLSTIHTNDAVGAITRLMDMGIEPFLISSVLLASFAQRLVRTVCPYCKESYRPSEKAIASWGLSDLKNADFKRGKGCHQCMNTGYKGRTGVFEVLVNHAEIQEMIMDRRPAQEIKREAISAGKLRTLKEDASEKILQGVTTIEEAASAVMI